jgi:hypothetical protein
MLTHLDARVRLARAAIDRGELEHARAVLQTAHALAKASEGATGPDTLLVEALLLRASPSERTDENRERAIALKRAIDELTGVEARAASAALDDVIAHSDE